MREGKIKPNDHDPTLTEVWCFYPYDDIAESEPLKAGASIQVWDEKEKVWKSDKVVLSQSGQITFKERPDLFFPESRIILFK